MYENLKYLPELMEEGVRNNVAVGMRLSVCKGEETLFRHSCGYADKEKGVPMSESTIFRLFSLTKPVTAAALMILLERGRIELRYPLKWFIPEFENPTVLDEQGTRPAERDITLRDLLTMTSGIPYPEDTPSGREMGALWGQQSDNYLNGGKLFSTVDFAREMGKRPLSFTPGRTLDVRSFRRRTGGSHRDNIGKKAVKVHGGGDIFPPGNDRYRLLYPGGKISPSGSSL